MYSLILLLFKRPAPAQFVRDMRDAGDYFGNRVLATNRGFVLYNFF